MPGNLTDKAVDAALTLAAERGWEAVSMAAVAERSGVSLPDMFDHFADRTDILAAYGRMLDRRVLESVRHAGDERGGNVLPQDRLFDLLMERFEILAERRDGVCAVLRSFRFDPKQIVIGLPHLARSMSWMLEAAGVSTSGVRGAVKVAGLSSVYLVVLRAWKDDDSADLGKTMAALDRALGRAGRVMERVPL